MIVYRWGRSAAFFFRWAIRSPLATVRVATTSVWVTSQRTASSSIRTGMCVIGTSNRCLAHSTRSLRVSPKRVS